MIFFSAIGSFFLDAILKIKGEHITFGYCIDNYGRHCFFAGLGILGSLLFGFVGHSKSMALCILCLVFTTIHFLNLTGYYNSSQIWGMKDSELLDDECLEEEYDEISPDDEMT